MTEDKTTKDRVRELISDRKGLTAKELSEEIFGNKEGYQQRVNPHCIDLVNEGVVERRGEGGPRDPFRYFPKDVSP